NTFVDRYEKNGPEMLTSDWKSFAFKEGTAEISNNEFYLSSKNSAGSVQIRQDIPDFQPGDILMLSAEMKYTDVVPGEQPWNLARLLLVQNDGTKNRYDHMHVVASFSGTKGWKRYYNFFTIGGNIKHLKVAAQLSRCTGSFQLKDLKLYPIKQTMIYTWVQRAILFSWGLFAFFLLGTCFGNGHSLITFKILLIISFAAIIIGTTMPQEVRNQISQEVTTQIQKTGNGIQHGFSISPTSIDPAKLGHFVFFALFGAFLFLLMGQDPLLGVAFNIVLLAAGTELAQCFIDGRSPLFTDFFIDIAGGGCGLILSGLIPGKSLTKAQRH
ncbi:MAG: VanZ family protein, partial [Deltaproteobacteria bacterium]|nr:VanZ family protein [Deltaproteobacteria bacterium]